MEDALDAYAASIATGTSSASASTVTIATPGSCNRVRTMTAYAG
jgi:hypothetical protein